MKVLVIGDCHLKPHIYERAAELMRSGVADVAVSLMDIPDDWRKQFSLDEYEKAFDAVIAFAKEFPDSLFCYGNHDLCYMWNERESGYSPMARYTVCDKIDELKGALTNEIRYIQKIDNVLFCHGGLCTYFVLKTIPGEKRGNMDEVVEEINRMGHFDLWCDDSPIWYRPQDYAGSLFMIDEYMQVVGHTPVEKPECVNNVLSCDLFSTYMDGEPIGTEEYVIVDTKTRTFTTVK